MSAVPLVRAAAVAPLAGFLERAGAPMGRCLESVGLSPRLLEQPDVPLPFHLACAVVEEGARSIGMEDLGARVGAVTPVEALGAFGAHVARAPTLLEALRRASALRWELCSGQDLWIERDERDGSRMWIRLRSDRRIARGRSEIDPYGALLLVNLVRLAAGPGWTPAAVELGPVSPGSLAALAPSEVSVLAGCPAVGVALEADLLRRPLALATGIAPPPSAVGPRLTTDLRSSVRQAIEALLLGGYPDVHLAAEACAMSVRTFQRRLAQTGTSYAELVEEVRCHLALRLLRDDAPSITEIALRLAYSDLANFSHAFRRWTGVSPRAYRNLEAAS